MITLFSKISNKIENQMEYITTPTSVIENCEIEYEHFSAYIMKINRVIYI